VDPLHVAHLICLALWGGVVLVEVLIELQARDEAGRALAAELHYRIDLLLELPLIVLVLVTGAALLARRWPPTGLLSVKLGAALIAIGVNLYCATAVVARRRQIADAEAVLTLSRRVRASAVGFPFAALAAALGLAFFRG
jgi:hypothetical protein